MIDASNRNTLWASILVDELARCGVRHAVIAPGSRSTPLAVAFSRDDRFKIHPVIDERAAAFFALGIGKASGMPAAVVCTSGTAAANFFPAIIEASMSHVPMIVMTADRPHELRDSGANQTIDQAKLYGGYVRWFVDVAPPHANPEDKTLRYLRTTVDRAAAASQGPNGGPVHLNIPFEKPLEPVVVEGDVPAEALGGIGVEGRLFQTGDARPFTVFDERVCVSDYGLAVAKLWRTIAWRQRGLIVCGPNITEPHNLVQPLARLSQLTGYPVLAEGLSGLRLAHVEEGIILGGYETFLRGDFAARMKPEIILQFGDLPVGASLLEFLARQTQAQRILISARRAWADEAHLLTTFFEGEPNLVVRALNMALATADAKGDRLVPDPEWQGAFQAAEAVTWQTVGEMSQNEAVEGAILADVIEALPTHSALFIANSNPVRHFDQFVRPQHKAIDVFANRGVSGIDGTVASALGVAAGRLFPDPPAVLVTGDLALYHDLNSLHLIRRLGINLVIVVINNDGGGIFYRLPIAQVESPFRDLFRTPHGLTFEHAAKMFDIPYTFAPMGDDLRAALQSALASGEPHLIEVPSDPEMFERQRRVLIETTVQRIAELKPVSLMGDRE